MKKIIKFITQTTCSHIWKDGINIPLRNEKERYGEIDDESEVYRLFEYFAIHQRCIKCEKERYKEKRKITLIKYKS